MDRILPEELEEQLMFLECALHNKVFSQDKFDEHLSFVMQDTLTEDKSLPTKYGSTTRKRKDSTFHRPVMCDVHTAEEGEFFLLSLFRNVDALITENAKYSEELAMAKGRILALEEKIDVLVDTHNAKAQYEINKGIHIS